MTANQNLTVEAWLRITSLSLLAIVSLVILFTGFFDDASRPFIVVGAAMLLSDAAILYRSRRALQRIMHGSRAKVPMTIG